jgi:hypothetical protein
MERAQLSAVQMVQVTPTIFLTNKGQRKSATIARIMEGDTTPTIQVTVNVTMPMELQIKSFSPTCQRAMTQREIRMNPRRNGEGITSNSHSDCNA